MISDLLIARNISKNFGFRKILRDVNIDLRSGETLTIFGGNGAGKTTLIRILATLLKPNSGEILIDDINVRESLEAFRSQIGIVIHEPLAYLDLSSFENLRFFGKLYKVADLENRIETLLDRFGLRTFAHEPIRVFSRGMLQKFTIVKALLHEPKILLFDEPFSGLDLSVRELVIEILEREKEIGRAILLTTHNTELGYRIGSRFEILHDGEIEAIGLKSEISLDELSDRYAKKFEK